MKTMKMGIALLGCLAIVFAAGCSGNDQNYQPPNLGAGNDRLTIEDEPLSGTAAADSPEPGEYLGFVFQARAGEVYDLDLERTSGQVVLAMALYHFDQGAWSDPLVWATADAESIGIGGWSAPATGTYLVLIEAVLGGGQGGFALTVQCTRGCDDPLVCADDADCPAGQVCWAGMCFEEGVECRTNAECRAGEICEQGFCVAICTPTAEICDDGIDNDCDGLVDEGCGLPCASDADCAPGEVCANGECIAICGCTMDADCPMGHICQDCMCLPACEEDLDGDGFCAPEDCDDRDPSIHPYAAEACDGLDNDCDGQVDEGCGLACASDADCPAGQICDAATRQCVELCDADADGDGYLAQYCGGMDCDDADASIHPGAPEACNGLDDDCDGQVDEGCSVNCSSNADCAAGQICLAGRCVAACSSDADCAGGEVCMNGLCQEVCLPGMEICDGQDNDCDGQVDEDFDLLSDPANCGASQMACAAGEACLNGACTRNLPCSSDADCEAGELCVNGLCVAPCDTDADGDGYLGAICGGNDCDDYDATIHPGAEEFCDGLDNDCDGQVDEACTLYCRTDGDCPAGQMCMNGVCVAG